MPFNPMMVDPSNEANSNEPNMMLNSQLPTITTTKPDDMHHNNSMNNNIIPNNNSNVNTMNQLQPPHPDMRGPIIEIATYAETDVFECYIRGIESHIVMRKVRDDWVNLTQMFKIGNFSKNQRTKILEKESSQIQHEKIQGGYGRFQGTWVPLDKAKIIAAKYNIIDPVVTTIINFIPDPNNLPRKRTKNSVLRKTSPGKRISSPSSYKITPKRRPQYENNGQFINSGPDTSNLSNYKKMKKTHKNHNTTGANPSPLQGVAFQTPQQSYLSQHSVNTMNDDNYGNTENSALIGTNSFGVTVSGNSTISHISSNETPQTNGYSASQKPLQFYPVPTNVRSYEHGSNGSNSHQQQQQQFKQDIQNHGRGKNGSKYKSQQQDSYLQFVPDGPNASNGSHTDSNNDYMTEHYNQPRVTSNGSEQSRQQTSKNGNRNQKGSLQQQQQQHQFQDNMMMNQNVITQPQQPSLSSEDYKNLILQTLSSEVNPNDESYSLPAELFYPPQNFNIDFLVDDQGHTSLHWAAAMANIPLIRLLLSTNANALHCNSKGFNAITKALFYNNNYKSNSFHHLLSTLKICLISPDQNGRLPLHYLVELSVNKSKDPAIINSYTETLLQILSTENYSLLEMTLNCQDSFGNTPLHLAALNLNISLFNKLCLLGASTSILNIDTHSPVDILSSFNLIIPSHSKANSNGDNELSGDSQPHEHEQKLLKSPNMKKPKKKLTKKKTTSQKKNDSKENELLQIPPTTDLKPHLTEDPTSTSLNMISVEDISSVDIFANPTVPVTSTITKNYNKQNLMSPQGVLTPSKIPIINSPFPMQHPDTMDNTHNEHGSPGQSPLRRHNNKIRKSAFLASPHFASLNENSRHFVNLVSEDAISRQTQSKLNEIANLTGVRKMVFDLNKMVSKMTNNIEEEMSTIISDTSYIEHEIEFINDRMRSIKEQSKDICNDMNITDVNNVGTLLEDQIQTNANHQTQLEKTMERSQALKIAKIMHEEEEDSGETKGDSDENNSQQLKLAAMLSLLQLQRQMKMNKIQQKTSGLSTSDKVVKYGRLMGMGFENLESKLDQIEKDLEIEV